MPASMSVSASSRASSTGVTEEVEDTLSGWAASRVWEISFSCFRSISLRATLRLRGRHDVRTTGLVIVGDRSCDDRLGMNVAPLLCRINGWVRDLTLRSKARGALICSIVTESSGRY